MKLLSCAVLALLFSIGAQANPTPVMDVGYTAISPTPTGCGANLGCDLSISGATIHFSIISFDDECQESACGEINDAVFDVSSPQFSLTGFFDQQSGAFFNTSFDPAAVLTCNSLTLFNISWGGIENVTSLNGQPGTGSAQASGSVNATCNGTTYAGETISLDFLVLDFTPAVPTPEPASLALALLGACVLFRADRILLWSFKS
ncbi:MAG TPA: hypothetical protein VGU63_07195 [Candidatus Acidoferrales bacterium]|nr:hypothetical protein [Candidatus Acidoferrales bacterium]